MGDPSVHFTNKRAWLSIGVCFYWVTFLRVAVLESAPVDHLFFNQAEPAAMLGNPLPVETLVFLDRSFLSSVPAIERGKVEGKEGFPVDTDTFALVLLNPEPDGGGILLIFKNLGVTVETSLQMEVTATLDILDSAMVDGQPEITELDYKVLAPQLQGSLGVTVHDGAAEIEQRLNQHRLGDLAHFIRLNQDIFPIN